MAVLVFEYAASNRHLGCRAELYFIIAEAQAATEQLETYNDIRRVRYMDGANAYPVALTNPKNSTSSANRWPLRLPYGESDVTSNPNVSAAFGSGNDAGMYIFTENVWWAGGNR